MASNSTTAQALRYVAIIAILAVVVAFIYKLMHSRERSREEVLIADNIKINVTAQIIKDRKWRRSTFEEVAVIGKMDGNILYRPGFIIGDSAGQSYVVDYGDAAIKKYGRDGKLLQNYGSGRGEGPGELLNPTDLNIGMSGEVWVADGAARVLSKFDKAGRLISAEIVEKGLHRIAMLENGEYYVMQPEMGRASIFHLYNEKGELLKSFGDLLSDPFMFMALDGWILPVDGDMIYSPFYYNIIVRYNRDGQVVYARKTMDSDPSAGPELKKFSAGGSTAVKLARREMLKAAISQSGGNLYVFASNDSKKRGNAVIDVYKKEDGSYLYSLDLPIQPYFVTVNEPFIYAIVDTVGTVNKINY